MSQITADVIVLARAGYNVNEFQAAFKVTRVVAAHMHSAAWRKIKREDYGRIARYTDHKRDYDRAYQQRKREEKLAASGLSARCSE